MVCLRNGGGRLREKARFTSLFTFCAEQKSREEPEQLNAIRGGDEYKALISTMLSYEKSKKDKDLEKIADQSAEGRYKNCEWSQQRGEIGSMIPNLK